MRLFAIHRELVLDPEKTPSARMLAEMRKNGEGFYQFAKRMSQQHYRYFISTPLAGEKEQLFMGTAKESVQRQHEIEQADTRSFDDFIQQYFAQH